MIFLFFFNNIFFRKICYFFVSGSFFKLPYIKILLLCKLVHFNAWVGTFYLFYFFFRYFRGRNKRRSSYLLLFFSICIKILNVRQILNIFVLIGYFNFFHYSTQVCKVVKVCIFSKWIEVRNHRWKNLFIFYIYLHTHIRACILKSKFTKSFH